MYFRPLLLLKSPTVHQIKKITQKMFFPAAGGILAISFFKKTANLPPPPPPPSSFGLLFKEAIKAPPPSPTSTAEEPKRRRRLLATLLFRLRPPPFVSFPAHPTNSSRFGSCFPPAKEHLYKAQNRPSIALRGKVGAKRIYFGEKRPHSARER